MKKQKIIPTVCVVSGLVLSPCLGYPLAFVLFRSSTNYDWYIIRINLGAAAFAFSFAAIACVISCSCVLLMKRRFSHDLVRNTILQSTLIQTGAAVIIWDKFSSLGIVFGLVLSSLLGWSFWFIVWIVDCCHWSRPKVFEEIDD